MIRDGCAIRDIYPDYVEAATSISYWPTLIWPRATRRPPSPSWSAMPRPAAASPDTLKQLATLLEEAGNRKEAAEVLDRLNYIHPDRRGSARRLGDLWLSLGNRGRHSRISRRAGQGADRPRGSPISIWPRLTAPPIARTRPKMNCCCRSKPRPVSARRRRCCWNYPNTTKQKLICPLS